MTAPETFEKISISLPTAMLEAIDRKAATTRRTRSNLIAIAMADFLKPAPTEPAAPTHREPIIDRVR